MGRKRNLRAWVNNEEKEFLKELRSKEKEETLEEFATRRGLNLDEISQVWHKGKYHSVKTKPKSKTYMDVRDEVIKEMNNHSPRYRSIIRKEQKDGHLLVLSPADIHIGKLASAFETSDEYTHEIAYNRVIEGVNGVIEKSKGFNIDKINLIIGNDILHIDTPRNTTTSGTNQDTSCMWYDAFKLARKLYVEVIEMLINVADVHVTFNPSNHDYMSGFMLADSLNSWFRKCKNISFDVAPTHRKYFRYHSNLIGSTHGDGAKHDKLPHLMAIEAKKEWSECKHYYIFTHHLHHKTSKDYMNVNVETLRSPSGTDSWHHRNGFEHSPKAIEGFIHHKEFGQVARITHIF